MNTISFRFFPSGHPTFDVVIDGTSWKQEDDQVYIYDEKNHVIAHIWLDNGYVEVMEFGKEKLKLTANAA